MNNLVYRLHYIKTNYNTKTFCYMTYSVVAICSARVRSIGFSISEEIYILPTILMLFKKEEIMLFISSDFPFFS